MVKASSLNIKLRHRLALIPSVAAPDLLTWFEVIGYTVLSESDIISGKYRKERSNYTEVVLLDRLRSALQQINPTIPSEAIHSAICQITSIESPNLLEKNRRFHQLLIEGVDVKYLFNDQYLRQNNEWQKHFCHQHLRQTLLLSLTVKRLSRNPYKSRFTT